MNKKRHLSLAIYLPIAIAVVALGIFLVLNQDNGHVPQAVSTSAPTGTLMPPTATAIPTSTLTKTPELLQGFAQTPSPQSTEAQITYPAPRQPEPGEAYRFENLARTEFAGVTYKLDRMLIARREVLPPEYYAYSPLLVGKETILYLKLVVTNSNQMQIYASPAGMLVLGDGEKTLDAFRLQDYIEAGTSLPHPQSEFLNAGEQYTIGYWLGTDVPPEAITSLKLVLSCPTAEGEPNCLGMEVGLRDVILDADLPESQGQPRTQVGDYSQALARSDLGTIQDVSDGLTIELLRLFSAPSEAVPEIADLLPGDTQTVVQVAYRFNNTSDRPLVLYDLDTIHIFWHFVPPAQPPAQPGDVSLRPGEFIVPAGSDSRFLNDFFRAGLSVGKEPDDRGRLQIQPGQAVIRGIWFGLPEPISQPKDGLFWVDGGCVVPADVEVGPDTECKGEIRYDTALPRDYQPFPETQEPAVAELVLPEIPVCQNEQQIQTVLQAAIPQDQRGLKFQTNGSNPPEMKFVGVTSGQVSRLTVSGRGPFEQETLDLAHLYFLSADGSPGSLWVAVGMTSTTTLPDASGSSYTSFSNQDWRSSEQAQSAFSQPGEVYDVVISDWYVKPEGVHWDRCYQDGQNTLPFVCDLGLLLDKDGSAQFFLTGIPPADYLAYGWYVYPNDAISKVALPGGCP